MICHATNVCLLCGRKQLYLTNLIHKVLQYFLAYLEGTGVIIWFAMLLTFVYHACGRKQLYLTPLTFEVVNKIQTSSKLARSSRQRQLYSSKPRKISSISFNKSVNFCILNTYTFINICLVRSYCLNCSHKSFWTKRYKRL